jgi:hypothetical protein
LVVLATPLAVAQDVADYVRIEPRPRWIAPVDIPNFDRTADSGRQSIYALIDNQNRHSLRTDEYSTRYVVDLLTPAAVDDEGTISLDFDPGYQSLALHTVQITRGDKTIDAIDLSEAMVFRTETDRDQMIFNGTLTFSMPILDVRVGDRLEVAFTKSGRNPALGSSVFSRRSFASTSDVKRKFTRLSFGPDVVIETKKINDPVDPVRLEDQGWTVLEWDGPDPVAPDYDQSAPDWAYLRPTYEVSNFASWADVGALFTSYYDVSDTDRTAVRTIVDEIAAAHDEPKVRAKAALDWVQTHIRYVGLELGEGGFVPRPPARVLRRRFGDCKDVTRLLLALLDGLDVSADPILVNSDERGGEFKGLANPYAFDHIIVVANFDGTLYPMDGTRDPQLGTLDTMEKGDIEFGLRMGAEASVVTRLPQSDYEVREHITDRFDLVAEPGVILYALTFREYGEDADATRAWIIRDGESSVQSSFVRYLADIYPTLEPDGDLDWEANEAEAWTELRLRFRLPGYTADDRTQLKTRTYQLLAATPDFEGGTRRSPFAIRHPRNIRHIREYVASEDYTFTEGGTSVETDAFSFSYKDTVEDNLFREDYQWRTKQDHISAENFETDMKKIDKLQDWNYTTINLAFDDNDQGEVSASTSVKPSIILGWLFLLMFPLALTFVILRSRKNSKNIAETTDANTEQA